MNNNVIEIKSLYKSFSLGNEDIQILKKIDLTVGSKDFLSIMGPSGSGKSTLLYLMGGLDKPTSGSIQFLGKDISNMKDKEESLIRRKDVGFIFQFYNLVPNLNVEDNVLLPILLDNKNPKDYSIQLNNILEMVGLSDRRKHYPRQLSGGQQQRVAIARALIHEPKIILADEPTGNLDTKTGTEIMKLLKHIHLHNGKSIIMVTHSYEAASYGNRIIHLQDGEIHKEEMTSVS